MERYRTFHALTNYNSSKIVFWSLYPVRILSEPIRISVRTSKYKLFLHSFFEKIVTMGVVASRVADGRNSIESPISLFTRPTLGCDLELPYQYFGTHTNF